MSSCNRIHALSREAYEKQSSPVSKGVKRSRNAKRTLLVNVHEDKFGEHYSIYSSGYKELEDPGWTVFNDLIATARVSGRKAGFREIG